MSDAKTCLYNTIPEACTRTVSVNYVQLESPTAPSNLEVILKGTPKPSGRSSFSSIHIMAPHASEEGVDTFLSGLIAAGEAVNQDCHIHRISTKVPSYVNPSWEYNTIFEMASSLLLASADRASLLIFVGCDNISLDAFAAFVGMLPFRGISVALVSQRTEYGDLFHFHTPSRVFDVSARDAPRMGMFPVGAVFGLLPTETFTVPVDTWNPISIVETQVEHPSIAVSLPFKIGGLALPMLNHNSNYHTALQALVDTLERHYSKNQREFFPIVSCGETCDALGYGSDLLALLTGTGQRQGYYFAHKSGETFKCPSSYADPELFACLRAAKLAGVTPLIIAVGGGVNGNSIGLIAALAGADFIEVPTTPMHFNDATTSAKKAFSLVRNNVILSKNIMGAFYLPLMVYCCSDMFLTLSSANAHATVGEATKTMNMLGVANSVRAAADYHNILGACEFASDFTKILLHSEGFNKFVSYIRHPNTQARKREILELGERIANLRKLTSTTSDEETSDEKISEKKTDTLARSVNLVSLQGGEGLTTVFSSGGLRNVLSVLTLGETEEDDILPPYIRPSALGSPVRSLDQLGLSSVGVLPPLAGQLGELLAERTRKMDEFRSHYYNEISISDQQAIKAFLTTINTEIVSAKAMFLAYSDPFEKYRALLFEYAHTLGHGIEAFANSLYVHAKNKRIPIPEEAERLHGQCVGMAVLWAGAMSSKLGVLRGQGLELHQSLVYLFNRHGGFTFRPLRKLCERLRVSREEMIEGVLRVVRRDNKRGYCTCSSATASVDQLVVERPGLMMRSDDAAAELRYLVEVPEALQAEMLGRAWAGEFDLVADLETDGENRESKRLVFRQWSSAPRRRDSEYAEKSQDELPCIPQHSYSSSAQEVGAFIHAQIAQLYVL